MIIIFEIVKTFAQIFSEMLTAIGTAIWENLPEILQFKQIMGYFTPAGIVALYLGVPTIVITVIIFFAKVAIKKLFR